MKYYDKNDFDNNETPQERAIRELKYAFALAFAMGLILFVSLWTHGHFVKIKAFVNLYIPMGL